MSVTMHTCMAAIHRIMWYPSLASQTPYLSTCHTREGGEGLELGLALPLRVWLARLVVPHPGPSPQ